MKRIEALLLAILLMLCYIAFALTYICQKIYEGWPG